MAISFTCWLLLLICIYFKSLKLLLLDTWSNHPSHSTQASPNISSLTMFTDTYLSKWTYFIIFFIKPTSHYCHVYLPLPQIPDDPSHKCLSIPICIFYIIYNHYLFYKTSVTLWTCSQVLFPLSMFILIYLHLLLTLATCSIKPSSHCEHVYSSYPSLR